LDVKRIGLDLTKNLSNFRSKPDRLRPAQCFVLWDSMAFHSVNHHSRPIVRLNSRAVRGVSARCDDVDLVPMPCKP
jgi:hypothetical protein